MRRRLVAALAGVALIAVAVVATTTIAWSQHGSASAANDTIQGCVNSAGVLRVLSSGDTCRAGETPITWNVTGPTGPQGPQGSPGPAGPAGPAGQSASPGDPFPTCGGDFTLTPGSGLQGFAAIDGVTGGSTVEGHAGEVVLNALRLSVANGDPCAASGPAGGSGAGGGASRPTVSQIQVGKTLDKASPSLFAFAATGHVIPTVHITIAKADGSDKLVDVVNYDLTNVTVTSVKTGWSGPVPSEMVSLSFSKIVFTYHTQNPDGSAGTPIVSGWDIAQQKAS